MTDALTDFGYACVACSRKVLFLVLVRDATAQSALLITIDVLELFVFVIQMPFADRWLNLDLLVSKTVSVYSFIRLGVTYEPSDHDVTSVRAVSVRAS